MNREEIKIKKQGFSTIEFVMVLIIIFALAIMAVPNLKRQTMTANDLAAETTIKMLGEVFDKYASVNKTAYPQQEAFLRSGTAPYLSRDYNGQTVAGHTYTYYIMTAIPYAYVIEAVPAVCNQTGVKEYYIDTGGVLRVCDCNVQNDCNVELCGSDYNRDGTVDVTDEIIWKHDFGRSQISGNPCTADNPCTGNFDGDPDVDGTDAATFLSNRNNSTCFR